MGEVSSPPGLSQTEILNLIAANSALSFVQTAAMTVTQLLANFPAGPAYAGMYARVTDLYNNGVAGQGIDEVLRCRYNVTNGEYRWQPQRESFNVPVASGGGSISLIPLVTPPSIRLSGTLTVGLTITPQAGNAYIGQKFRIIQNSTLGVFVTQITGLLGSNITLLGGGISDLEYTSGGWVKAAN